MIANLVDASFAQKAFLESAFAKTTRGSRFVGARQFAGNTWVLVDSRYNGEIFRVPAVEQVEA
ncbi:hypothetical protein CAI21_16710 [Alkalilimnicola ehrlichii]|uniref:Uncharacterized protein n=1 Tax=Alkalilimnicola ehrlichii TaxID=351052 RepID=A0A3E0WG15_9GAMM|nr:hypothetical protein CAI21_16710 [Alkalilimnicola ehrlichii]RFA31880.1 hypothetical protein CAL65_21140 [Alkalilimnicola ehrlichii]